MRAFIDNSTVWFIARDVCAELGIEESKIHELKNDHKSVFKLKNGETVLAINERGLRKLIPVRDGDLTLGEFAKELKQHGVDADAGKLAVWFYKNGYYDDIELFSIAKVGLAEGCTVQFLPKVTPKGREFFIKHFVSGNFQL